MVQDVEELSPELDIDPLAKTVVFEDREVNIDQLRAV